MRRTAICPDSVAMLVAPVAALLVGCGGPTTPQPVANPTAEPAPAVARATPAPIPPAQHVSALTTEGEKRRALVASLDLAAEGRCRQAIPLLESLLTAYPELEDYHLYHLGRCAAATGDNNTAAGAWAELLARYGRSVFADETALAWGHQLHTLGDDAAAEPLLRRASIAEDADLANLARLELAEIELARGNVRTAYVVFEALREDESGEVAERARAQVFALRARYHELAPRSSAELEAEARLLLREGDHASAARLVNGLLATAPTADQPRLLRLRALVALGSGDSEGYLSTLREIGRRFPAERQQVLFEEARWLWNRDRNEEAREVFLEIERRYPRHARIATVHYALARIAQDQGDNTTALRRFGTVIDRYPRSDLASESRWQVAWIHYYERRWDAAERQLGRLGRSSNVTYWRARTLDNAGSDSAARQLYERVLERAPDSYYAIRANQRLGIPPDDALAGVTVRPTPFPRLPLALEGDYHLTRARELQAAGLNGYARREVRAFVRDQPRQPRDFMIELYRSVDAHRSAIRLVAGYGDQYSETLYPLAFWNIVTRNADRYGIDPVLVVALMRQESLFDPEARSPANARGLMQLLPSTAEDVAGRIGRGGRIDLYDPAINIELGVAHLRELADRYGGDHVRVLAAYNAGAGAVSSWDRRYGNRASDEYVESITYRETRDYVKKVLANYRKYQRMYGALHRTSAGMRGVGRGARG